LEDWSFRAADAVSRVAFERGVVSRNDLQKLVYGRVRGEFGLAAQAAVRTVKKVVDDYATLRGNIRAGRLGPAGSKRRRAAESKPVAFRPDAGQPYDDRMLSWQMDGGTVSVWTIAGRVKGLRFAGSADQLKTLAQYRRGESDLVCREGKWFLVATCEVPAEPVFEPGGWIGDDDGEVVPCQKYTGNDSGGEPEEAGSGPAPATAVTRNRSSPIGERCRGSRRCRRAPATLRPLPLLPTPCSPAPLSKHAVYGRADDASRLRPRTL
jgi:hypothetical protein